MTVRVEPDRDVSLQGHYAGIVTRLAAFGIDVLVATTLFTLGGNVVEYLLSSLLGKDVSLADAPVVSVVAICSVACSSTSRTPSPLAAEPWEWHSSDWRSSPRTVARSTPGVLCFGRCVSRSA